MRDIHNKLSTARSLSPAARTASADGASVDLQGYDAAEVVIATGTITDGTHTIEVQESADDSTFTAVADGDLIGTEPAIVAADDDKVFEIGYIGTKRFLRVITTVTGATTGGVYGAAIVRSHARKQPV
jgi:hypothetical protein